MTLSIDNLTFERHDQPLFNQLNYTLNNGELLQVHGANGSGKSTLLRIIAGYIKPEHGAILWNHQPIFQHRDDYQQIIAYLGHENAIKPYLTVYENLKLINILMQAHHKQIDFIIEQIGLHSARNKMAWQLSAGQARRLALARLLLCPRLIWILDEPTTALDNAGQILFATLLNQHLTSGGIAIISSHHDLSSPRHKKTLQLTHGVEYA